MNAPQAAAPFDGDRLRLAWRDPFLWIVAAGFLCRLAFFWAWEAFRLEDIVHRDTYYELALVFLGKLQTAEGGILYAPGAGYPMAAAALMKLAGTESQMFLRFANVVFSALAVVPVGYWAARLTDARTGRLTAFLAAFAPSLVFFAPQLQSEAFYLLLLAVSVWAAAAWWDRASLWGALGLGALFGATNITRSALLPFLPFLAAALALRAGGRRNLLKVALLVAGWGLPLLLWGLRNLQDSGHFVPLTAHSGRMFYVGLSLDPAEKAPKALAMEQALQREGVTDWHAQDARMRQAAVDYALEDPLRFARILVLKGLQFWRPWPYPPYPPSVRIVLAVYFTALFALAAAGLWLTRRRWRDFAPAYGFLLSMTISHCIFDSTLRYRAPLEPFLFLFAAAAVMAAARRRAVIP